MNHLISIENPNTLISVFTIMANQIVHHKTCACNKSFSS